MFKLILLGFGALLLVFLIVVAMQPTDFRISRSATFAARPEVIFEQINDLHNWNDWSPWAKLDPNAKHLYEGPPAGVGAGFGWAGNKEVGEGRMTITESRPSELVRMRLEFLKPFTATNTTEFTLTAADNQTAVTWTMSGKNNFAGKAMGLIMNCEKMIGGQFEQGFANLSPIVEAPKVNSSLRAQTVTVR
jgi:hypothetical protein